MQPRRSRRAAYIGKKVVKIVVQSWPRRRVAVKLDPAILRSYAGDYRLEDRFTIKVTVAADRLETTWLGQKVVMVPESETAVFEEDADRTFRFTKDDNGKVTGLIISVPEELTLRKLP